MLYIIANMIVVYRYLVETGTGVFTGSVFNDKALTGAGHYGEAVDYLDGSTILQKTHHRLIWIKTYLINRLLSQGHY